MLEKRKRVTETLNERELTSSDGCGDAYCKNRHAEKYAWQAFPRLHSCIDSRLVAWFLTAQSYQYSLRFEGIEESGAKTLDGNIFFLRNAVNGCGLAGWQRNDGAKPDPQASLSK
jgi:hypothetical protein